MKTTIPISGMSCATCAATVEEAVGNLPGIASVDVTVATDEALVAFDPDVVSLAEIYTAVEDAGYEPDAARTVVGVAGMSCATCSGTVEDAVSELPGVITVDANFATDEAVVRFNPDATTLTELYDAIESAGYDPDRQRDEDGKDLTDDRETAVERDLAHKQQWVIIGGVLAAPFALVMLDMLVVSFLPGWFDWVEFLLASLGFEFLHQGGVSSLASKFVANLMKIAVLLCIAGNYLLKDGLSFFADFLF